MPNRPRSYFGGTYERAHPQTSSAKAILIVTEGKETEPRYFNALKKRLKLGTAVVIQPSSRGTDPKSVVDCAIAARDRREKLAKHSFEVPFDEIWCVFDLDNPTRRHSLANAINCAQDHGINIALSRPCFEFWVLLHDEYTSTDFPNCTAVARRVKAHYPQYTKSEKFPADELIAKVPKAVLHARRLRAENARSGKLSPSTDVDRLVVTMNESTRSQQRLPIKSV